DIEGRIGALLAEREPVYRDAHFRLDTSYQDPQHAALQIAWRFGEPRIVNTESGQASPVHIIPGLLRDVRRMDALLPGGPRVFMISDDNVMRQHGDSLCETLAMADREVRWISLPAGEQSKSLDKQEAVL